MVVLHKVYGVTGEYADRTEWDVALFDAESDALQFADICNEQADALLQSYDNQYFEIDEGTDADPDARFDYTGTHYYVLPVNYMGSVANYGN